MRETIIPKSITILFLYILFTEVGIQSNIYIYIYMLLCIPTSVNKIYRKRIVIDLGMIVSLI